MNPDQDMHRTQVMDEGCETGSRYCIQWTLGFATLQLAIERASCAIALLSTSLIRLIQHRC
jgi:hypothetical protein